ncbi:MAG: hypothetical protein M3094_04095 [Actinomycetia bacterium]|nr:hypothetical protein [Actinomycetes bacterium]
MRDLVVAPDGVIDGILYHAAFRHTGTAARLVHNLKYRRCEAAGRFLAEAMAQRVPMDASVLVPMVRSRVRRIVHGIDQAVALATAVSQLTGLPVAAGALEAPVWWKRRAGSSRDVRRPISFRATTTLPDGVVLVDDVLTTGATVLSGGRAIAPTKFSVLVATTAGRIRGGTEEVPNLGGDVATERRMNADRSPAALGHPRTDSRVRDRVHRARSHGIPDREEHG